MKFGKQVKRLADPKHLNHYIAYDVLKKAINVVMDPGGGRTDIRADLKAVRDAFGPSGTGLSGASYRPPDSRFHGLLLHELAKVNRFAELQLRTILDTLREAQRLMSKPGPLDEEAILAAERVLDQAAEELVVCEHFRRLNFTGFRKIVKKFDKRSNEAGTGEGSLASWFIPQLLRERFAAVPLDSFLLALSMGCAAIRRHRRDGAEAQALVPPEVPAPPVAAGGAVGDAARAGAAPGAGGPAGTTTFWLTPPLRVRAICTLIKRFEIVVPPTGVASVDGGITAAAAAAAAGAATAAAAVVLDGHGAAEQMRRILMTIQPDGMTTGGTGSRFSVETSLVYYDGPGFPEYLRRVRAGEVERSRGFRCRQTFVGARTVGGAGEILVERDGVASALGPHAFTPVPMLRSPDAFPLGEPAPGQGPDAALTAAAAAAARSCGGILPEAAALSPEAREQLAAFAREVDAAAGSALHSGGPLAPVAAVGSVRVLLRGDTRDTEHVSIALDEDVQFSRGPTGPAATAPIDTIDFSYCLLEVASDNCRGDGPLGAASASWVEELLSYGALRSVAGFSVGAHAVAALHKEAVPELPHWYQHYHAKESTAPPEAWGLTLEWRAAVGDAQAAGAAVGDAQGDDDDVSAAASVGAVAVAVGGRPPGAGGAPSYGESRSLGPPAAAVPPPTTPRSEAPSVGTVEPKNFLASERTMLEWMHTVLALAFFGLGLWQYSLSQVGAEGAPVFMACGILNQATTSSFVLGCYSLALIGVAVIFVWYSVLSHLKRLRAIYAGAHTEGVFNRRIAPGLFAVAVGLGLVSHLGLQVVPIWLALGVGDAQPVLVADAGAPPPGAPAAGSALATG